MKHTLISIFLLVSSIAFAQKSDVIKYHLVLDNSGSINWMDRNNNLIHLMEKMSYIEDWSKKENFSSAKVSFDLLIYGGDVVTRALNVEKINEAVISSLQKELNDQTDDSVRRSNLYSDVLSPLLMILEKRIEEDSNRNKDLLKNLTSKTQITKLTDPSQGIIIFTDGILTSDDIYPNNLPLYDQLLASTVSILENLYKTPVFFVVTNQGEDNLGNLSLIRPFFKDPVFKKEAAEFYSKNRVFWVDSGLNLDVNHRLIEKDYQKFQMRMNTTIVTSNIKEVGEESPVKTAYQIQELENIKDVYEQNRDEGSFLKFIEEAKNESLLTIPNKDELYDHLIMFMSDTAYTNTLDFSRRGKALVEVSKHPEVIHELKMKVFKKESPIINQLKKSGFNASVPEKNLLFSLDNQDIEESKEYTGSLLQEFPEAQDPNFDLVDLDEASEVKRDLESDIIIGFSDYVIERVKLESVYSLFDNLKFEMEKHSLDIFFPETWELLSDADNYTDFSRINNTFQRDLNNLPKTISNDTTTLKSNAEVIVLYYIYTLIDQIIVQGNFQKALSNLSEVRIFDKSIGFDSIPQYEKRAFLAEEYILFSSKLISFLKEGDIDKIFVDTEKLEKFTQMITEFALYEIQDEDAGLKIILKNREKLVFHMTSLYQRYKGIEAGIIRYKNLLESDVSSNLMEQREYRFELLLGIIDAAVELLIEVDELGEIFDIDVTDINSGQVSEALENMEIVKDFYFHIRRKEYADAVYIAAPLISKIAFSSTITYEDGTIDFKNIQKELREESLYLHVNEGYVDHVVEQLKDYKRPIKTKENESMDSLMNEVYKDLKEIIFSENTAYKYDFDSTVLQPRNGQFYVSDDFVNRFESEFINSGLYGFDQNNNRYNTNINWNIDDLIQGFLSNLKRENYSLEINKIISSEKLDDLIILGGEVSQAKSSQEVKEILSKRALPVASYRIKRNRPAWMITAYAGFSGNLYTNTSDDKFSLAVSAPVGIEYSSPIPILGLTKSMSFMAVLFDVGNVVEYRALGDSSEESVDFESIFSPGGLISIGFWEKVPLALNVSYLTNPNRASIALVFDLPLFNLSGSY